MSALGAAFGLVADDLIGEPPVRPHPVALLGRLLEAIEHRLYRDGVVAGAVYAASGAFVGLGAGRVLRSTAAATYLATAGRALGDAAIDVHDALEAGDLDRARNLLPALVSRDSMSLDEPAVVRAVVESVAENTVDAVVAPALWAAVGGAPGASVHRVVDTMDSMVGYRNPRYRRFGAAAAHLDDAMAWVPARFTALLVAAVEPAQAAEVLAAVRRDAPAHPSPNAGVAEAAFAAALGLALGGENRYGDVVEIRPPAGRGRPPTAADILRAVELCRRVEWACAGSLAAASGLSWVLSRGRSR